jgi:flavodoxin I
MKKTAIIYSFRSQKSKQQAQKIAKAVEGTIEEIDADTLTRDIFMGYDNYILAVPTWFDGELPNYWDEFLPAIENEKFKGKKFAIYGGGDQKGYPENFIDAVGVMAEFLEDRQGKIVGFTSTEGYTFEHSRACRGNQFVGLALDIENQAALTKERIDNWGKQLSKEFK